MRHQPRLRPMLSPLTAALLAALVVVGCDSAPDLSGRPTEADEPVIRISRLKTSDDRRRPIGGAAGRHHLR